MTIDLAHGLTLLVIGFLAGTFGIIVGAGGGFLFVPALLIYLRLPPPVAAGTGLLVVFVNSLSGISGFVRQKRISYGLALRIVAGGIPGAFLGVWLAETVSSELFYKIFAALLVSLGVFLIVKQMPSSRIEAVPSAANGSGNPAHANREGSDVPLPQLLFVGLLIGTISSYFGIGGGWLLVPILVYLFRIRPHIATATVIFSLSINSIVGGLIYIFHGNVDWIAVVWGGAGVIVGAQLGVYLSSRISGQRIIQLLALVLIGVGIKLFLTR